MRMHLFDGVRRPKGGASVFNMPAPAPRETADDPAALVDTIRRTFEEFRTANDARLQGIEQRFDDVVQSEKVDRINAAIDELKQQLEAEQRRVARLTVGGGNAQANDIRVNAARMATIRSRRRVRPEDVDVAAYEAYGDAFAQLVLAEGNVDVLGADIRAALSVGSDPGGGYLVPTERSTEIEQRLFETSAMRSIARVIPIMGTAWEAPYKSTDATSGGWVGERQSRSATGTPQLGAQRIETHEQYAYPEVTQSMLDDAALNVESFIVDETEDKMSRTENLAFVSGDGVMKPKGFLAYGTAATTDDDASRSWGKLQYVPTGQSSGFPAVSGVPGASDTDCLITLMAKLHPTYRANANFVMSRATEAAVRKLKDADGRYLVGFGDIRDNAFGFGLFGTPIVNLEDMPTIGSDSFSIAYGDFRRGYYIIDRSGFRLLRDPYTNKPYVGFYITKRTGGDVRNFDAIKLLKFASS